MMRLLLFLVFASVIGLARAAPVAAQAPLQDCADCPEMMAVPAGGVSIGSSPDMLDRKAGEGPRRRVQIARPFALSRTEITKGQFRAFVAATGYRPPDSAGCNSWDGSFAMVMEHDWRRPGYFQAEDHPVVCVSYEDAAAYAAWLAERTGQPYRLPSSTEFEYAARAGGEGAFPWGNDNTKACRFANIADLGFTARYPERPGFQCRDGYLRTAPVGRFEANGFGLYDMIGNAWEWTADCGHDGFAGAPDDGSAWLQADDGDCSTRTPRGGAWISGPVWARAASQARDPVGYRSHLLGFRVARDLP